MDSVLLAGKPINTTWKRGIIRGVKLKENIKEGSKKVKVIYQQTTSV